MTQEQRQEVMLAVAIAIGALRAAKTEFDKLEEVIWPLEKALAILVNEKPSLRVVDKEGR